jgi:hypothetical protein
VPIAEAVDLELFPVLDLELCDVPVVPELRVATEVVLVATAAVPVVERLDVEPVDPDPDEVTGDADDEPVELRPPVESVLLETVVAEDDALDPVVELALDVRAAVMHTLDVGSQTRPEGQPADEQSWLELTKRMQPELVSATAIAASGQGHREERDLKTHRPGSPEWPWDGR